MNKRRKIRRSGLVWVVLPNEGVEIPAREVDVNGEWFISPRHINRIDINNKDTHGWQVRYRGQSSFFSDNRVKGDKKAALENAKSFLQSIYKDDKHLTKYLSPSQEHKDKELKLYPGVSGLWRRTTSKGVYEFYFQVIAPIFGSLGHRNIKIYACTENTFDKKLIIDKATRAIALRRYFEQLFRDANSDVAKKLTLKDFDDIDLSSFEKKFPTITTKKLNDMLAKAKKKWG